MGARMGLRRHSLRTLGGWRGTWTLSPLEQLGRPPESSEHSAGRPGSDPNPLRDPSDRLVCGYSSMPDLLLVSDAQRSEQFQAGQRRLAARQTSPPKLSMGSANQGHERGSLIFGNCRLT